MHTSLTCGDIHIKIPKENVIGHVCVDEMNKKGNVVLMAAEQDPDTDDTDEACEDLLARIRSLHLRESKPGYYEFSDQAPGPLPETTLLLQLLSADAVSQMQIHIIS